MRSMVEKINNVSKEEVKIIQENRLTEEEEKIAKERNLTKEEIEIIREFKQLFYAQGQGLETLITVKTNKLILEEIVKSKEKPIAYDRLTQLFGIANVPKVSKGFYEYYWLEKAVTSVYNTYKVTALAEFVNKNKTAPFGKDEIRGWTQFKWGIHRIILDGLLYFGNINIGFEYLCEKSLDEIRKFFLEKIQDHHRMIERGDTISFKEIPIEHRFLVSEGACKTFATFEDFNNKMREEYIRTGCAVQKLRDLYKRVSDASDEDKKSKTFAEEIPDEEIADLTDFDLKMKTIKKLFDEVHKNAVDNTQLYLSIVDDLDVYMATSMRTRADFEKMGKVCDDIFYDERLKPLKIRFFNPTISAAEGHEDKGLIECLMVKRCKVLVYSVGEIDSYGKAAEAAMALSLGKPVIFLCENNYNRANFYRNTHPLSRLVHFDTGVANGAMIAENIEAVIVLLQRIFTNEMEYDIKQKTAGYYTIVERSTTSVVRLQTNDANLSSAFWTYYKREHT